MKTLLKTWFGLIVLASPGVFAAEIELSVTNNLLLRLDGSDVTLSGSKVSHWHNQAVGPVVSADFVQSASAAQPTLVQNVLNGHPVLKFNGSSDHLFNLSDSTWDWNYDATTNMVDAARWTMFFVCKPDVKTGSRLLFRSGYSDIREGTESVANTGAWGVYFNNATYYIHGRNTAGNWVDANWPNNVETEWQILGGVIQNTTDPAITFFRDGDLKASTNNDTTRQMSGHIRTRIGASSSNPTANEFFNGQLAEVLIYKEVLTAAEIEEVNRYLTFKYGIYDKYATNLVLHCRMDNKQVIQNGVKPPPALTTADGDWIVKDLIEPVVNGIATSDNTSGSVLSSAAGVIGEAIQFSQDTTGGRRVDFGVAESLAPGNESFTVSLWFKPTGVGGVQFIASHGNLYSGNDGWSIWLDGTTLFLRLNSGGVNSDAHKAEFYYRGIQSDQWYHAALVIDRINNRMRGYINGSQAGFIQSYMGVSFEPRTITSGNKELLLGVSNAKSVQFKGCVDDLAIWKRMLSANEVAVLYALGVEGQSFVDLPPPAGVVILIR
ncbi:MAG: hypothetical protein PHO37_14625 [Kiritimatiellae bacterium]|nr:hypothetical protein [Kiritimatiellia bacterium]